MWWQGSENSWVDEHIKVLPGTGRTWRGHRSSMHHPSSPIPCPMHLFHSAFLKCSLYNKPVRITKALSWVWWAVLTNYWTWKGRDYGNPLLWSQIEQKCGYPGHPILVMASEVMVGLWDWALKPMVPNANSKQSELNWIVGHLVGAWNIGGLIGVRKKTHILSVRSFGSKNSTDHLLIV